MLTGDSKTVGEAVAKQLGLDEVYAELLPDQKVEQFERLDSLKGAKKKIAFVGDGINDAPALKQANVGIAMGTGTDIAIEAGDIVLTNGSLVGVVKAINLSKATFSKIKQNSR